MKRPTMKLKQVFIDRYWTIFIYLFLQGVFIFSLIFSFSFVLLKFSFLSLFEKIIVLLVPWILINFSLLFFLSPDKLYPKASKLFINKQSFITLLISVVISLILLINNINLLPSWNQLEINVNEEKNISELQKSIVIPEIMTIDSRSQGTSIPYFQIQTDGECILHNLSFSCGTNKKGTIRFQEFSNNGTKILFQGSPSGAKVNINWNGNNQIIDTYRENEDLFFITYPYQFIWDRQSPTKKIEIILLISSNVVSIYGLILFIFNVKSLITKLMKSFDSNTRIIAAVGYLLIFSIGNILAFIKYQNEDIFRLQRVQGNSLIDLDKTSHDNIKNFQVYMNFWSFYRDHDFFFPTGQLDSLKLSHQTLIDFSRAKSINEIKYNPELSSSDLDQIKAKKLVTIMPAGLIPHRFELIVDPQNEKTPICLWRSNGTIYFIPIQDKLNCLKDNE
jgi:hypothetical protein